MYRLSLLTDLKEWLQNIFKFNPQRKNVAGKRIEPATPRFAVRLATDCTKPIDDPASPKVFIQKRPNSIQRLILNEPRGFRPGLTQTRLYSRRRWLEA